MHSQIKTFRDALFLATAILTGIPFAMASDWPEWGGPSRNGIANERDLIEGWPESQPPIRWRRKLGQGYSAFVIRDGRAYTQYQDLFGQYLACLNLATGETIWTHRYEIPYETAGIYPGPRSTPAIAGDRIVFVAPHGVLGCVNRDDGQPLWSVNFKKQYHGRGTEFGDSAAVRVFGNVVVVPVGGRHATLVAFDVKTGREVWKTGDSSASYAPVQPISIEGRPCGLAFLQNSLLVVDLKTGEQVWSKELSHGYDEHAAIPLIEEDYFLLASPFRAGAAKFQFAKSKDGSEGAASTLQVKTLWEIPHLSNDTASSVLWNGAVYGFDLRDQQAKAHRPSKGEFRCIDWNTGQKLWSTDRVGHATVLVADGKLILFNDRGELILAKAEMGEYRELARMQVFDDGICWTAPALAEGHLLLRSHEHAACIDLRKPVTHAAAGVPTRSEPAIVPTASRQRFSVKAGLEWLINGEREHPFMRPEMFELKAWFGWSLMLAVFPGCLLGWLAGWRFRTTDDPFFQHFPATVCGSVSMMAGGLCGGVIANRFSETFVFTWPAALFGLLVLTIDLGLRFQSTPLTGRGELAARGMVLGFAVCSLGYFLALRSLSLPHEWIYLMGYVPATPALWGLARCWQRVGWTWWISLGTAIAYALFFWSCAGIQLFLTWRERVTILE